MAAPVDGSSRQALAMRVTVLRAWRVPVDRTACTSSARVATPVDGSSAHVTGPHSSWTSSRQALALGGQPRGLAVSADGTVAAVTTDKAILLLRRGAGAGAGGWRIASSTGAGFGAQGVALSPDKQVRPGMA